MSQRQRPQAQHSRPATAHFEKKCNIVRRSSIISIVVVYFVHEKSSQFIFALICYNIPTAIGIIYRKNICVSSSRLKMIVPLPIQTKAESCRRLSSASSRSPCNNIFHRSMVFGKWPPSWDFLRFSRIQIYPRYNYRIVVSGRIESSAESMKSTPDAFASDDHVGWDGSTADGTKEAKLQHQNI